MTDREKLKNALNGLKNADVRYLSDAIRYPLIYAIEKQIEIDLLPPSESSFTYKGICPVCNNRILLSEQYCSKCGQKLGNVKKDVKIEEYAEANEFAQEFNLTAGKKYKVLDFNGTYIKVKNDLGNEVWYSLEYFCERSR